MKTLFKTPKQISVDQIIQKVLIRNTKKPYDYKNQQQNSLIEPQKIWNFQLQQQNNELKQKISHLNKQFKKKHKQLQKKDDIQLKIIELQEQLHKINKNNKYLQDQINKIRIKRSIYNQDSNHDIDMKYDHNRSNLYDQNKDRTKSVIQNSKLEQKSNKKHDLSCSRKNLTQYIDSPQKDIMKHVQNRSINCNIDDINNQSQINGKKQNIIALKNIIKNQQKLINQYKDDMDMGKKHKTMASGTNIIQNTDRASQNQIKCLFSPGTIVKIRKI